MRASRCPIRVATLLPFAASLVLIATWSPRPAAAQDIAGCQTQKSWTIDRIGKDHIKLIGQVQVNCTDETFFADEMEMFTDQNRVIGTGNVVFTSGTSRIAAERVDFNTVTKTGTFYQAAGSATLQDDQPPTPKPGRPQKPEKSMFGTQEADVYFYGERIDKVGEKKYKVTKGGFTTCLQPSPRWRLTSGTVTVKLEHYALLTNSLMRVKDVPILYLPVFYYPVRKDDRATGFLMPTYGGSTVKGQTLSNAFFWAISRSQDATFLHDWFSKTGQGFGGEYRYIQGPGSDGYIRAYNLREHEASYVTDGVETTTPERTSYQINGNMSQKISNSLRARGRVDYFSSLEVQQTYNMNVYDASRRQRSYSGSLTGNWREYNVVGTVDRTEYFYGTTSSSLRGGTPHILASRGERPLFGSPVYFSVNSDFNHMDVERVSGTTMVDQSLTRFDLFPRVRVPFTKWQWFTINSTAGYRYTYWTESRNAQGTQIDEPITRNYYELAANMTGPVFNRIWGFKSGAKLKHSIEPYFNVTRDSAIDDFDRYVQIDSTDLVVGKTTRVSYGMANRLFKKVKAGRSREFITATIGQSYYTDAKAAIYDQRYQSNNGTAPSHFSPLAISVRAIPTDVITANFRTEYDTQFHAVRTMSADASFRVSDWWQSVFGWSQRRFIEGLPGFNDPTRLDHYFNGASTVRFKQNRYGGIHQFNYDILRHSYLQQRFVAYYNAQCCGFAMEYQTWDLSRITTSPVARDRRLNFTITLAGIGSFSNLFGSMGGNSPLGGSR